MVDLNKDIQFIKGVGPNRASLLHKLGIFTLEDLICYFPRTYEDRSKPKTIETLINGEEALIEAIVVSNLQERRVSKKLTIYKALVQDETGTCQVVWYNQSYLKDKIKKGKSYKFYGKANIKYGSIEMASPVAE